MFLSLINAVLALDSTMNTIFIRGPFIPAIESRLDKGFPVQHEIKPFSEKKINDISPHNSLMKELNSMHNTFNDESSDTNDFDNSFRKPRNDAPKMTGPRPLIVRRIIRRRIIPFKPFDAKPIVATNAFDDAVKDRTDEKPSKKGYSVWRVILIFTLIAAALAIGFCFGIKSERSNYVRVQSNNN